MVRHRLCRLLPRRERRKVKVSARTKTEAKAKLKQLLRDRDDGHALDGQTYTVRDAVESWLAHGLTGRQDSTVVNRTILAGTEELRALTWSHTDLDGDPPSVQLWRSVREGGNTKTRLSRRTLELPNECVVALRAHRRWQTQSRIRNAARWPDNDLVFTTQLGTPLDAANVRRAFREVAEHAGLQAEEWTPRELRHSFVSLLSSAGIPIEDIAHLVGHANTRTTEKVYRKELRPVLRRGAKAMDDLFKAHQDASEPPVLPPVFDENQTER